MWCQSVNNGPDERLQVRHVRSKPLADKFQEWMLLQRLQVNQKRDAGVARCGMYRFYRGFAQALGGSPARQ
jgi:hypothetical protein